MAGVLKCVTCGASLPRSDSSTGDNTNCPRCRAANPTVPAAETFDLFFCHSSADKDAAALLCNAFEKKNRVCWIAPRNIPAGKKWAEAIVEAIAESKIVLLLMSKDAVASEQVMNEIEQAVKHQIPILPVRLEAVDATAELSYFISRSHWFDAFPPPLTRHVEQLVADVGFVLSKEGARRRDTLTAASPKKPQRHRPRAFAAISLLLFCGVAVGASYLLGGSSADVGPFAVEHESATTQANDRSGPIWIFGMGRKAIGGKEKRLMGRFEFKDNVIYQRELPDDDSRNKVVGKNFPNGTHTRIEFTDLRVFDKNKPVPRGVKGTAMLTKQPTRELKGILKDQQGRKWAFKCRLATPQERASEQ